MTSHYLQQERQLKSIIAKNVSSEKNINLLIYYQNMKLKNLLIKNKTKESSPSETSNVVYQFNCPEVNCSVDQKYIGYTTNSLSTRMTQHFTKGAIREHGQDNHDKRFSKEDIINNTVIIKKDNCANNLRIMEAVLIKKHKPSINRKDEGRTRTLLIF